MDVIIMAAVVGGVVSLFIVSKILSSRPKLAYGLMILIPAMFMACAYFAVMTFSAFEQKADMARDAAYNEVVQNNDVAFLQAQLKANPDDLTLVSALSGTLIAEERYDEAIALIEGRPLSDMADERLQTQYGTAYFAKGLMAAENKQYEDALKLLQRAQDVTPEGVPFMEGLDLFIELIAAMHRADKDDGSIISEDWPVFDFRSEDSKEAGESDAQESESQD